MEVFAEYSASSSETAALFLALPTLAASALAILAAQGLVLGATETPSHGEGIGGGPFAWPGWVSVGASMAAAVAIMQVAVPLAVLCRTVGSPAAVWSTVIAATAEIRFTTATALAAGVACAVLGLLGAECATRREGDPSRGRLCLLMLPLALPAPLVGIGLIGVGRWLPLGDWMPALAATVRFAPVATLTVLAQMRRVDRRLLEAATVTAPSRLRAWVRVKLVLVGPGLLAAALACMALTTAELGATLLVAPPGKATLAMRTYNYLHYGATDQVAGLCLAAACAAGAAGVAAAWAFVRGGRAAASGRPGH